MSVRESGSGFIQRIIEFLEWFGGLVGGRPARSATEAVPEALEAAQLPAEPNGEVLLFEGPLCFEWEGGEAPGQGRIFWQWLPSPGLRFEAEAAGDIWEMALGGHTRVTPDGWSSAKASIAQSRMSGLGGGRHSVSGRILEPALEGEPAAELDELTFELSNYHVAMRGRPIQALGKRGREHRWSGRAQFLLGDWSLTLDQIFAADVAAKQVKAQGGFAATHAGSLKRSDGSAFDWEGAQTILQALHFWFAFTRGLWVGPLMVEGRQSGETVLRIHSPTNLSPYQPLRSWCPQVHGQDELEETAARFLSSWNEGLDQALRNVVWWYVEATAAQAQDSKIVLIHSALELLGWVELVERQGHLSVHGFKRLPAADQLRLLLGHLGIPREIPAELGELEAYASAENRNDGPDAFYGVRNALVHPSLSKREEIARAPRRTRFEAAELGLYYIELILLAMLGHQGPVLHRVSARWRGEEHPVPWVTDAEP